MKKASILFENVRRALVCLYFVSHKFSRYQYEDYVRATHIFLDFIPNSIVTSFEIKTLDLLSNLVTSYSEELSEYNIDTRFYSYDCN